MAETFPGFMAFGAMSLMLLIGVLLRAKIKFLQTNMVPASLIGGILGFILVSLGWLKFPGSQQGWITLKSTHFLPFAFHAFTISFISLCLTRPENKVKRSMIFKGGMWLALMWTASLTLQALVGAGTVWLYNLGAQSKVNVFLGYLVTHGFTQGPGQGIAMGTVWSKFGVEDAVSMGLIWATFGFLAAYAVGVPIARGFVKKGMNANRRSKINNEFLKGFLNKDTVVSAGRETTHSSNIDTLAYHLAIIGLVYVVTYFEITFVMKVTTYPLFSYPLFFFHGLLFATLIRMIMDKIGIGHLTDPGIQKRITGLSVDFLLVSSIMGISFQILTKYIVVIIMVTISVTLVTYIMIRFFGRRLKELGPERALTSFGCCTGSAASGLLLLRILDPDYSTTVALELAFFNVAIGFTTIPILAIMVPNLPNFSQLTIFIAYALNIIGCFVVIKLLGLWNKPQTE